MNRSLGAIKPSISSLSRIRVRSLPVNFILATREPAPLHQFTATRSLKIDHKNLSPLDVEKELFKLKRQMGAYYSKAAYAEALKVANELNREVLDIMGPGNTVHASCLNDIGLMQKMLGNKKEALEKYNESLVVYEEVVGRNHMSYVKTSANLGVLYKSMADSAETKEEAFRYLDLAEDTLKKSLAARIDLHGPNGKEVLVNQNHVANILRCRGNAVEAEAMYTAVLKVCREDQAVGNWDSVTALTLNNLGLLLKQCGEPRWEEAEKCYLEAVQIRKDTFGESHQDTIVSMHNLAEFYLTRDQPGDRETAGEIQQRILDSLGEEYKGDEWSDDAVYDSLPSSSKHGEVADKVEREQEEAAQSKEKLAKEKEARLEAVQLRRAQTEAHRAAGQATPSPAGELGGYFPGQSTMPPPRSPVTAFVRAAPANGEQSAEKTIEKSEVEVEDRVQTEEDVLKKIFNKMMSKHTK